MDINSISEFKKNIISSKSFVCTGLTTFLRLFLVHKISTEFGKKILFITSTEQTALKYQRDFRSFFEIETEIFPYQNSSMYEPVPQNIYDYSTQINTLLSPTDIIITPIKALLEKLPSKYFFRKNSFNLKIGDEISQKDLLNKLIKLGYKRSTMVNDISEFSIRGDIADIYTLKDNPVRIEFWGDEIVDIRYFNRETQKSIEKIQSIDIMPIYKFILPENPPKDFPKELIDNLTEEGYFEGIEVYQSYFNNDLESILDYLDEYIIVFDEKSEIITKYQFIEEGYEKQIDENLKTQIIYNLRNVNHVPYNDFIGKVIKHQRIELNNFIDSEFDEILDFNAQVIKNFNANIDEIAEYILEHKEYQITIATDYPDRVKEILARYDIYDVTYANNISANGTIIEDSKFILITDRELFNKRTKEVTSSKRTSYKEKAEYIESINDIKEGEYVVHSVHGVGIYIGLTQQELDGQLKDYLTIEYAQKDRLHIPAEQINLLCRYRGAGAAKPKLSRMGGTDWEKTKTKVKQEVEKVAYDLLRLYARRQMQAGIAFDADSAWQLEMEDAFEYTETPDQMKAINDIKADMESTSPMDRLICGDVGFGKTEVAMRGIFKAVASGKQVAVVVPTTILALQHFQTISERFKPYGINVDLLCRFRTHKEQKETLKNMVLGSCDVVVGTHRLLQDGVIFKDLGLLVIDEEHRFGVKHKERLKEFRENIDIISMSATPIPRTLYMSLSGIKDMSVINTPPKNRLPIKTFVGTYNDNVVKNAIIHELDRDGQVYYLYNRVETIEEFRLKLKALVPNARIAVGHAKLSEKELEEVIVGFSNHEYDVLLCTTIIENGLDIPNANTMIIHDADKFGLAQLYQLRGRVGRSERQAYCYCLYKSGKNITTEAMQRLSAIKEFTTLGSGYQIAMRDVEIRGVGNILGTKQHGHMVNVGFDTYCQLLEETVNELKGEIVESKTPTIVDINVTAFIPEDWVGSKEQKMIEYKRLADVKNETELNYIISEWKDRFSKIPEEVENLTKLVQIRLMATKVGITVIRESMDNIRVYTPFRKEEWRILQTKLPRNLTKNIQWTVAPKTCQDAASILLINNSVMNFDELFNILYDLFYDIDKISHEYEKRG
ncbi:MAG: transcription-repair coupling factor [Candidatus Gastranaerophilaceae bacterium]